MTDDIFKYILTIPYLNLISSSEFLSVRRREERNCHTVSPAPGVGPGPGEQQHGLRLALALNSHR